MNEPATLPLHGDARRVSSVDVETVRLPFVAAFSHSRATHDTTASVLARVRLDDGSIGVGEGAPRPRVTGERLDGCAAAARERARALRGVTIAAVHDVDPLVDGLAPAARCALELALLDALARSRRTSVLELLGIPRFPTVRYSMVFAAGRLEEVRKLAQRAAGVGFAQAKIEVGADAAHDEEVVRTVRAELGPEVALRADANGAWSPEEALERCRGLFALGVSIVEDPLPLEAEDALPALRAALPEGMSLLLDDAVLAPVDARRLLDRGAADRLLLKVSKQGGLLRTLAIAFDAEARGVPVHLGSHLGETSILSAAGRVVAGHSPLESAECSWGSFLVERDVTDTPVTFGAGGHAPVAVGPLGLGVRADAL